MRVTPVTLADSFDWSIDTMLAAESLIRGQRCFRNFKSLSNSFIKELLH